MQLILEADNSDINIKEKMTTVEDSIEKLMNGVADIERTPEKVSNIESANSFNGDRVIESQTTIESGNKALHGDLQASADVDVSEKKTPSEQTVLNSLKKKTFNGDFAIESQENIETEDKAVIEEVSGEPCEEISEKKTSEIESITSQDNENSFNVGSRDNVVLEEGPAPPCEYFTKNKTLDLTNISNVDHSTEIKQNIEIKEKAELELLPSFVCKDMAEHEVPEKDKLSSKENSVNGAVIEIQKNIEIKDKTALGEAPREDLAENDITPSKENSHVLLETCETTSLSNDAKYHVDIIKENKMSFDKVTHEKQKVNLKDVSNVENFTEKRNDEKYQQLTTQEESDNKNKNLEEKTEYTCKEAENKNGVVKQSESGSKLCEEVHNDIKQVEGKSLESQIAINQSQEHSNDVDECYLKKDITDKYRDLIPKSESYSNNTVKDKESVVSPAVDISEISAKMSCKEGGDLRETDMECEETVLNVKESNDSTQTPMDCDNNGSDLIEYNSTNSLLDHEPSNKISLKEDTQVKITDILIKETTTEESKQDENAVTEPREVLKDTSTSMDLTVDDKIYTSEENETIESIKKNKAPEKTVELEESPSGLNQIEDKSCPDSLTTTYSICQDVKKDSKEVKVIDIEQEAKTKEIPVASKVADKPTPVICKLSNTLNILSDDEDEPPKTQEIQASSTKPNDKQCINIEDDDDVMVIEDTAHQDKPESLENTADRKTDAKSDSDSIVVKTSAVVNETVPESNDITEPAEPQKILDGSLKMQMSEKVAQEATEEIKKDQPLLPKDLFKSYKKNLTEMTRDELEEFCILKIVESIIDRSSLNEIKTKLKTMAQTIEEYKKKAMMLTKQNRDLQVVLKSVQEEQKKGGNTPIVPLKITRSVGMQVLMTDKNARRKVNPAPSLGPSPNVNNRPVRNANQGPRQQTPVNATNQQIPVPRLVPALNNAAANKATNPVQVVANRNTAKPNSLPNGVRNSPPAPKVPEKRGRAQSITVDLTDDEPPPKILATKTSPAPPVRLVPSQNLLTPRAQMTSNTLTNPRKVYIPIGSNQNQPNVRPGQTIMLKNMPSTSGPRPRGAPPMSARGPTPNQIRMSRVVGRHPAPLPDAVKQYQPPNWKALPPAPDLKLSKVENGIVISWKIDGYQEDSYEEIASYQLYAYQETSTPPNTSLWKKIGDVKALPLPMACTLTQFMAGYKYYFAVRAVDIRSRLGPFSLPGSILLLNKM